MLLAAVATFAALAAAFVTVVLVRPWTSEESSQGDDVPDWLKEAKCDGVTVERQICARCARRRTAVDSCAPTDAEVEYAATLLWQQAGSIHEDACDHEWIRTGATRSEGGGHGNLHVSADTLSIRMFSDSPTAVAGLQRYAAAHGTTALELFRELVHYAETRDESYESPYREEPSEAQIVEWLEQNIDAVEQRVRSWSPSSGKGPARGKEPI